MGKFAKTVIGSGLVALTIGIGSCSHSNSKDNQYKDIVPNQFPSKNIGKVSPLLPIEDLLYRHFTQGSFDEFKKSLNDEFNSYSKKFNIEETEKLSSQNRSNLFSQRKIKHIQSKSKDKSLLISYLEGDDSFLRKTLDSGLYFYASGISKSLNLDPLKINELYKKSYLQDHITGNKRNYDSIKFEIIEFIVRNEMIYKILIDYHISKHSTKEIVINKYGFDKKTLTEKVNNRYQEFHSKFPNVRFTDFLEENLKD
jgi:hypothetical protein